MKKLYILLICTFASTVMFASEVFTIQTEITVENTTVSVLDMFDFSQNDQTKKKVHTSYSDGKLTITGVNATSNIAIYNLLGRKVIDLKNVAINGTFSKYLDLPKNNIYIVKITSNNFTKTFKIIAK
ncbi:T9SS type A sorting domain-containing protein [Kordia sp.]|uniref:T9SS type A sorting domain-containing protein n=1 Tax=Kordia sp. TaxID=1965332 RepID=UPI003D2B8248